MWEGLETLGEDELRQDLRARGLPTVNLTAIQMRENLAAWLSLSQKKEIPYSLLILMNMLHFAGARGEPKTDATRRAAVGGVASSTQAEDDTPELDVDAA